MEEMEVKVGGGEKVVWGEEVKARGEKVEVVGEAEEMEEMGVKVGGGEKVAGGQDLELVEEMDKESGAKDAAAITMHNAMTTPSSDITACKELYADTVLSTWPVMWGELSKPRWSVLG
ncbi:hypothetical protein V8C86DRAFT_3149782 [Haematococcus lacustris]